MNESDLRQLETNTQTIERLTRERDQAVAIESKMQADALISVLNAETK
jgi:hypothetical protein